jgi:hypothetical protein
MNIIYLSNYRYLFNKTQWHSELKLTPLEELPKIFVVCGRSYKMPTVATRSTNFDMTVEWLLNPSKQIEFAFGGLFWNFLLKTPLNSGQRFCGKELEHTKCLFGLICYFNAMTPVALLVAITGVASLLLHSAKKLLKFFFQWCKFHLV